MSMPDVQRALALIEDGQHDTAIPLLEDVTRRFPTYVFAHVVLARTYEALERWEDALVAWRNARFLMPSSPAIEDGLERTLAALLSFEVISLQPAAEGDGTLAEEAPAPSEDAAEHVHALLGEAEEEGDDAPEASLSETTSFAPEAAAPPEEPPPDELFADAPGPPVEAPDEVARPVEESVEGSAPEEAPAEDAIDEGAFREIEQLIDERLRAEGLDDLVEQDDAAAGDAEDPDTSSGAPLTDALRSGADDDLDTLIQELESARFEPRHDLEDLPEPDLDNEIEDMVSETLARIYAAQDKFEEAAKVYEQLAIQQPDRSITFLHKAAEMRARAAGDD
jgi:tetratricopeptide (TPR) repeat protein